MRRQEPPPRSVQELRPIGLPTLFSPKKELSDSELKELTDVDFSQVVALVVTMQKKDGETLIGGGRYAGDDACSAQAELAFMTGATIEVSA